jgi:formylmethanofuran dehydrogenase subunit E
MKSFDELLTESVATHGHLCAGQVIGVRMAMLGCRLVGIDEPKSNLSRKKLIVYVEIDRCATDAIQSVTGCQMGKRTLKFRDFGINAATFLNLETSDAYRIISTETSRKLADNYAPEEANASQRQLVGYQRMPDEELFSVKPVKVSMNEWEMPGPPRRKAICRICGQVIRDGREIIKNSHILCRPCAGMAYFIPTMSENVNSTLTQQENVL